jgi:histidinol-phosphate/aromatic aminotransferase/cobyric acid decarboxylase-like protein/choline kinase
MQAIILAAGMGKRLGTLTQNNTKCMVEVNGVTLIDRLLNQLSIFKLNKIIIVIGYEGLKLKKHIGNKYNNLKIQYIENTVYDKTNNIYSLSLAKNNLQSDDTILIESDLILEDSLFNMLIENPFPNLALVDKYETWMDGTMLQLDDENNIIDFISRKTFKYKDVNSYYKTVNIYKFSKEFSLNYYVPFLEAYTKALGNNEYYEQVLRVITLLDKCHLKALPLSGQSWYEIDDRQDLDIAETLFANTETKLNLYQKRYGGYWRFPNLLDFCYLVNPYFPTSRMCEEIKANFDVLLRTYPSGLNTNNLLIAKYFNLNKHLVCIGNGATELIKSLMEYLTGNIGMIFPTFEEYSNRSDKKAIIPLIPSNNNFTYTIEDIKQFCTDKHINTMLLLNPDNPSGNFIFQKELLQLVSWCADKNIRIVVDESFIDFSIDFCNNTLLSNNVLHKFSNLVAIKSISKSYGIPGLRLGIIASSDPDVISFIRKNVSIWNINSFAEFYMQIFGKYENDYKIACNEIIKERDIFFAKLQTIKYIRVIPSQANYFLCEVVSKFNSIELTTILLNKYNILIKDCSTKKAFNGRDYIRIAVRNNSDNNKLIQILKKLEFLYE